jgi:CDP-diacylglycerol--glycerol-3-phosphate 3-phosphatidyltransferase
VLNIHARDAISRALVPLGTSLAKAGLTPDVITVVGTAGTVAGSVTLLANGYLFAGTLVVTFFVLLDMVDGAVARASGRTTTFGAVLDSSCDRISDTAIFGAIAWYFGLHGNKSILLAALLCLGLGALTSYIRARAEAAGLNATVGFAERAERLIIVLVGTGLTEFPGLHVKYVLEVGLWLLVAASTTTVAQRFAAVYNQTKRPTDAQA